MPAPRYSLPDTKNNFRETNPRTRHTRSPILASRYKNNKTIMETNNIETKPSIEQVLDNLDHNTVYKTKPSIVLSLVLIVLGIAAIMLNGQMPGASEGGLLSPLAIVVGILLLTWGIVAIFIRKTKYIYAPGKQPIVFHELLFDLKERDRLVRLMNEGNVDELKKLKSSANDALKLRVASTPDGSLCYSQVVAYIPFEFVNANEARKHSPEEARTLLEMVKARK